jgi:hypothetical protein
MMTGAYLYQGKSRVRRVRFPLTGEWAWRASKHGNYYLVGDGLHFYRWRDAMDYVTAPPERTATT